MAITIYDIAREANVGIGTVSRVLNNSPKVTDSTRKKVIFVAKKLNYQPHAFAQALARKRSNTLSAVIPFFSNYFFIEVLRGVHDALVPLGYDLIIHGVTSKEQMEDYFVKDLKKGRVDGTLLFSLTLEDRIVAEYCERKIPLVLVDTFHPKFDSIRVDNIAGARIAVEHLIAHGHKKFGMINANVKSTPARERLQSFKDTLTVHQLPINEAWMVSSSLAMNDGFSRESGYESMKELLARQGDLPTALFVSSDIQAIGVLEALREKNIQVPRDLSLISFDDIEIATYFNLTTMQQPMYLMGELAVRRLLDRIENPLLPVVSQTFTPSLIVRSSCGVDKNYTFHPN